MSYRPILALLLIASFLSDSVRADDAILSPAGPAFQTELALRQLDTTHRVLYVTAHPDDEDAGLIAWFTLGKGVDVTLLTLTRGNGGQNEIGPELHDAIAVLRTAELESAHRWDFAEQWFGSADDFGYSFSVEETYRNWGRERMVRELVEAIRLDQPTIILTMSTEGTGGGQHHQASARLTEEAAEIAGTERWPELGAPWTPSRVFTVVWGAEDPEVPCLIPLGRTDPMLGVSFAEIGTRSRSMHKCQGMVRVEAPLPQRVARLDLRIDNTGPLRPLDDPLEGLERPNPLSDVIKLLRQRPRQEMLQHLHFARRYLRKALEESTTPNPAVESLQRSVSELARHSFGVRVRAAAAQAFTSSNGEAAVIVSAENAGRYPVEVQLELVAPGVAPIPIQWTLEPDSAARRTVTLRRGLASELLDGAIVKEIPARLPAIRLEGAIGTEAERFPLAPIPVEGVWRDETFPTLRATDLRVVPDPSLRPARAIEIAPRTSDDAAVARGEFLLSTLTPQTVEIELATEVSSWVVEPAVVTVETPGDGIEIVVPFTATAPTRFETSETKIFGTATPISPEGDRGTPSREGYRRIEYPHIRTTALKEEATVTVRSFLCEVRPREIGFVVGVGDALPRAITALGLPLTELSSEDLLEGDLSRFETIVLGVRAYKVRTDLQAAQPRLMEWVRAGGTLICQYHKFEFNAPDGTSPYVPYPGAIVGRGRITDETALVAAPDPTHPLLQFPNPIGDADWLNWVQERGLYFLDVRAGTPYQDLLTIADSFPYNAGVKGGSLVEASVGEGLWIYVGLGLWRQTPAGVPGAVRILANLLARGAE